MNGFSIFVSYHQKMIVKTKKDKIYYLEALKNISLKLFMFNFKLGKY